MVDPWAVVIRHGRWYLLCWSHHANEQRAYRLDRIAAVEALTTSFSPPADLDPVAALEDHLARGWAHDVVVDIDAPAAEVQAALPRRMGVVEPVDDHTCRLIGSTNNPDEYLAGLALLGVPFTVTGEAFRSAALALADRLRAAASAPSHP